MKFIKVEIPDKLKDLIENINWYKVKEREIDLLILFAKNFLKQKGLLYEKENKEKKHTTK